MKPKVRTMVLLAMLPLFVGMMIGYTVNSSEAQMLKPTHPDVKKYNLSPKSYGSANTLVCGDRLCAEGRDITPAFDVEESDSVQHLTQHDKSTPTAKLIQIVKVKPGSPNKADSMTYIITFKLASGNTNLKNIAVHVSTDIGSRDYIISSLDSYKTSMNVIRVKALDPDSIDGSITGYELAPPTSDARNPNR